MENSSVKYIVYCTTCTVNKFIYVGVHKTNPEYFDGYIGCGIYSNNPSSYNGAKTKFQLAVKQYGPSKFIRTTVAIFDKEEDAFELERHIVNDDFLKRSDVYNVKIGGGSYPQCPICEVFQYDENGNYVGKFDSIREASIIINRSFRHLWRAIEEKRKCAGYFFTKTLYDKLDLSKMHSQDLRDDLKRPVFQYNSKGEYDCCYESSRDAARVTGFEHANLMVALKLGTKCNDKYFTSIYAPTFDVAKSKQITSSKIYRYDLNGNYIDEFESQQDAKNKLHIKGHIYKAIKLGRQCEGYLWSFDKLDKIASIAPKAGRARRVGKYDTDGNLLKEYRTLQECKNENGSGMYHVLNGRDKTHKGFVYKFLD